ncbi:hypothetical protein PBI_SCTP2_260 [Salicola phage SCTP-2]|nr:hypothetical protein PBI_SCTP2_260 [Salicola phage SCTP-2]
MDNILNEKLIELPVKTASEGHAVVIMGSAGSGKNFSVDNFTDINNKFKHIDIDDIQYLVVKSDKLFNDFRKWLVQNYSEFDDYTEIELRHKGMFKDETFVEAMNSYIKHKDLGNRYLDVFLKANSKKDRLPNVALNGTFSDIENIKDKLTTLFQHGYTPEKTHLVWVFTTLEEALENNRKRLRTVSDEYLKSNYKAVFDNVYNNILGVSSNELLTQYMNGRFWIIINQKANTKYHFNDNTIVKDFYYLPIKDGQKFYKHNVIEFTQWLLDNANRDE